MEPSHALVQSELSSVMKNSDGQADGPLSPQRLNLVKSTASKCQNARVTLGGVRASGERRGLWCALQECVCVCVSVCVCVCVCVSVCLCVSVC